MNSGGFGCSDLPCTSRVLVPGVPGSPRRQMHTRTPRGGVLQRPERTRPPPPPPRGVRVRIGRCRFPPSRQPSSKRLIARMVEMPQRLPFGRLLSEISSHFISEQIQTRVHRNTQALTQQTFRFPSKKTSRDRAVKRSNFPWMCSVIPFGPPYPPPTRPKK